MKFAEALGCLLKIDEAFYPTLFDFNDEWKIDQLKFMEDHFSEDMSMEEFATYTRRSLATFKRDFAKISSIPTQKWLIEHRLEKAADLLSEGTSVIDTYVQVGFRNRLHFTKLFSAKYNCVLSGDKQIIRCNHCANHAQSEPLSDSNKGG